MEGAFFLILCFSGSAYAFLQIETKNGSNANVHQRWVDKIFMSIWEKESTRGTTWVNLKRDKWKKSSHIKKTICNSVYLKCSEWELYKQEVN